MKYLNEIEIVRCLLPITIILVYFQKKYSIKIQLLRNQIFLNICKSCFFLIIIKNTHTHMLACIMYIIYIYYSTCICEHFINITNYTKNNQEGGYRYSNIIVPINVFKLHTYKHRSL